MNYKIVSQSSLVLLSVQTHYIDIGLLPVEWTHSTTTRIITWVDFGDAMFILSRNGKSHRNSTGRYMTRTDTMPISIQCKNSAMDYFCSILEVKLRLFFFSFIYNNVIIISKLNECGEVQRGHKIQWPNWHMLRVIKCDERRFHRKSTWRFVVQSTVIIVFPFSTS